jgi:ribosomal protein S18 acetylase RimI-like enzyme
MPSTSTSLVVAVALDFYAGYTFRGTGHVISLVTPYPSIPHRSALYFRYTSSVAPGRTPLPPFGAALLVEILDLRHFAAADLRSLIEEEVEIWRSSLHWDYRPSADMVLRYADSRILPGFAAIERGRVRGYCYFVYEGAKGVIGDLFVESTGFTADRRQEIEFELLRHSIGTLQRSPGLTRIEAQLLIHPSDHLAAPFLAEDFRRYRRLFLSLPIDFSCSEPTRPLPPDIELHRWSEDDYQPAASIITAAYRGHVDSDVNDQYRTVPGSLRFLNNIVRFPGCGVFDPGSSFVAVHRPTRTRIGILLCSRIRHDVGHITQVCTLPDYRSHGIGEHLLRYCYADLAARRFTELSLTVTEENQRAVALYLRSGYRHIHTFDGFVWEP